MEKFYAIGFTRDEVDNGSHLKIIDITYNLNINSALNAKTRESERVYLRSFQFSNHLYQDKSFEGYFTVLFFNETLKNALEANGHILNIISIVEERDIPQNSVCLLQNAPYHIFK